MNRRKKKKKATTKSIPLLQPEHEFCQKDGSECGQTKDWHLNEKDGDGTRLFEW